MSAEEDGGKGKDEEERRERGKPHRVKVREDAKKKQSDCYTVEPLYNTNTIRTKIIVLISEVLLFQVENNYVFV